MLAPAYNVLGLSLIRATEFGRMLGGLYGDLPPPQSSSSSSLSSLSSSSAAAAAAEEAVVAAAATDDVKWPSSISSISSGAIRMTPPTMLRKAGIFAAPPSVLRNQSAAAAAAKPKVPVSKPAAVSRWAEPEKELRASSPPQAAPPVPQQPALVGASACVVEEYDPARPNDYEEYCRERRRRKMEEEMKRDIDRRRQEDEDKERERELARQRELEKQRDSEREAHISGEEAWKRRGMLSAGGRMGSSAETAAVARSPSPPPTNGESFSIGGKQSNGGSQMTAAQRMMARMGWKEGQGLGKQEQGITTPLMAKKTDKRAGVIVNAGELKKQKASVSIATPTRVILLRNMVGPGEVDVELQDEVASECSKYGVVTSVLIYEIIEQDYSPTEAVRIFVQFERAEQATKALADLDGRFFGGRVVKGTFYDEDRFSRNELAPLPGEAPSKS